MLVINLNKELPIKNYRDIVAGVRGYYHDINERYRALPNYPYNGDSEEETIEISHEFERIGSKVNTFSKLLSFTCGEECNYWSQTEHFYYWTRLNPKFGDDDYCVYIKAYRKE